MIESSPLLSATMVNRVEVVSREPPRELLDVTNILDLADPMRAYCDLLLNAINALPTSTTRRDGSVATISRAIWETTLVRYDASLLATPCFRSVAHICIVFKVNTKAENQPAANWNGGRKSLYLVVYLV
jgi:hypothetical protein